MLGKKVNSKKKSKEPFYIIGIGSSAGGLKALEEFFDNCPPNTGFAYVIVQHLSPHYKSLMPELLSRHTEMSVKEAKEGDTVLPNHVYLIPGGKNILIKGGKLELRKRLPDNQVNFSIDIFFNSLAMEQKEKALAIILSGTGSDGTKGAKSIKEVGGTVFVQTPETSGFEGMPKSAISHGLADYVIAPKEMGNELMEFVSHPEYAYPVSLEEGYVNNEESLGRILKIIKNHTGYDFFYYKKPTLLRRTAKRINITKSLTVENYIDYLYENPSEMFLLTQEYLIGVTKFFRDSKAFEVIKKEVIPDIIGRKSKGDIIKIWIVACSTGEEAYSISILIEECLKSMKLDLDYKIFATDLDDRGIDIATKGVYDLNIEAELHPTILSEYFIKKDNKYQISPNIRKNIIFSKHDILQNPPFNKMDLVSCRNMLIYMENNIQAQVLSSLHYSLNSNGYLFLGNSENLGSLDKNFEEISGKWKIYKNINPERSPNITNGDIWKVDINSKTRFQTRRHGSTLEDKIAKSINKLLMDEMQAVSVCVDENFEIIHASGKLKKYIQYPDEGYSNNLLKILPDELNIPINTSIRKLPFNSNETIEKQIKIIRDNKIFYIRLIVCSFNIISVNSRSFLVTLIEEFKEDITNDEGINEFPQFISDVDQVIELKEALNDTRENLQSTIEELETSNEEMQATNEELLASNEELQSTNEELQSLNEELHTVNAELQTKNIELIELNSDIENLMRHINVGTIFLDRQLKIRKFNPSISDHYHLQTEDIGRSITHFSGTVSGLDITKHSEQVIKTLQPYKREVKNNKGYWFLMQIFPYRNEEDKIQGVIINFININESKVAIDEKEKLNRFLKHLTSSNPANIYIHDIKNNKISFSSSSILKNAGYSKLEVDNLDIDDLKAIIHPKDLASFEEHQEKLKTIKDNEELQIEFRIINKKTKKFIWILSTDKINERGRNKNVKTILGNSMVITKTKAMKQQLRDSEERYRLAIKGTKSGLWEWSNLLTDEAWWSEELCGLLGYTQKELKPSFNEFIKLINPDQIKVFRKGLELHIENNNTPFEEEIQIRTKKSGYKWFRVNGQVQLDKENIAEKIVGTILDIDEKKQSVSKMKELNIELERFAYLASHDLKEPLRTVTSFTKLFKEEYGHLLDGEANEYLGFIEDASSRMITLTNDLLVYSQLDNKSLNFEPVNLVDLLDTIVQDIQIDIAKNKAKINIQDLPIVTCDSLQIRQLFQNLISNSLKYRTKKTPKVNISYRETPSYYEFIVEDNGIGIEKKYHSKIFEVFKRLHSQEEFEGTGIGLANCRRIVDNHNGKIWLESSLGKGSKFLFTIPKNIKK